MKAIACALITCTALVLACFAPDIADRYAMVVFSALFGLATLFYTPKAPK